MSFDSFFLKKNRFPGKKFFTKYYPLGDTGGVSYPYNGGSETRAKPTKM